MTEKQKRWNWQGLLIGAALALTVYNILPTLFYYARPLKHPVQQPQAEHIAKEIAKRVHSLEEESRLWLASFCDLLGLKPKELNSSSEMGGLYQILFASEQDAALFRRYLPRAGALIGFPPAQLRLVPTIDGQNPARVAIQRSGSLSLAPSKVQELFEFSPKWDAEGNPTDLYRSLVLDRLLEVALSLGGTSELAFGWETASQDVTSSEAAEALLAQARTLVTLEKELGGTPLLERMLSSCTQSAESTRKELFERFLASLQRQKDITKLQRLALQPIAEEPPSPELRLLLSQEELLADTEQMIKRHRSSFLVGTAAWTPAEIATLLKDSGDSSFDLQGRHPFIESIRLNWKQNRFELIPYADLETPATPGRKNRLREAIHSRMLISLSRAAERAGEEIVPSSSPLLFSVPLSSLEGSESFLALRLAPLAKAEVERLIQTLSTEWRTSSLYLSKEHFPIVNAEQYAALPPEKQDACLVVYAPLEGKEGWKNLRSRSIYVVLRGIERAAAQLEVDPSSSEAKRFSADLSSLRQLLQSQGLTAHPRLKMAGFPKELASSMLFEKEEFYRTLLAATRESFSVLGSGKCAILEFTSGEQRILAENRIEDQIHEDLLRWRDDYRAGQAGVRGASRFEVPKPTHNPFWSNLKLSTRKYFRGDNRKVLKWGLDLSGGKTVKIELRDATGALVSSPIELQHGIDELYARVDRLGVAEVGIRREGQAIVLDFPGSQEISASELVQASSMRLHVVNEKFSTSNPVIGSALQTFLEEVYSEAVMSGVKDSDGIHCIAWRQIYGDDLENHATPAPRSEAARALYEYGLRLAHPLGDGPGRSFDDSTSRIALMAGNHASDWYGQTTPLLLVFHNLAAEGSDLENIHGSYDPSKGHFLSFDVKRARKLPSGARIASRDDLYLWTSHFSRERIEGTHYASYSQGRGWRMAVILNGKVISAPTLDSPLKDSAMISGHFTQREVQKLEADLKAGSLSYAPRILSEENVSPELGARERTAAFTASALSLLLIVAMMVGYYRFAGAVAAAAVLCNLLVLWASLQNLHATITLAGIAALILTLGMAVDANVLVFERIREELARGSKLGAAVANGYKKAFSAILDSNITTILAGLVLLQLSSGPIRGFALTLIIGILSSMFTALFMTRVYFTRFAAKHPTATLAMAHWFKPKNWSFLKYKRQAFIACAALLLCGLGVSYTKKQSLYGMEFTGGFALTLPLQHSNEQQNSVKEGYRHAVEEALKEAGLNRTQFQVRELDSPSRVRIFIGSTAELQARPNQGSFEENPKAAWIIASLQEAGLQIDKTDSLGLNWSEVSGQMSSKMKREALIATVVALAIVLLYIALRFEFKYAISATLCMACDTLLTLAAVALLSWLGLPLQIDLHTIAAILMIVGYSLNDTIIVFDRIREETRHSRGESFQKLIDRSLNITLSRTLITSGTTLVVLLPLVVLGGATLFGFCAVMAIGIVVGTLSSLYIATPLLEYFHRREQGGAISPLAPQKAD